MDEQPKPAPDWAAIRIDYETDPATMKALAERHGVGLWMIQYRARRDGWASRHRVPLSDRARLIGRMMTVLERHISKLEKETEMKDPTEKEVALLGTMARTLDKLISLEKANKSKEGKATPSRDMAVLRTKLSQRIDRLKGG